jgi:hypothetical protein
MRTRNQVKIEAIASSCLPKVWHLNLGLPKEHIIDDLRSLSFIPTIDRLSFSSTQSKGVQINKTRTELGLTLEAKDEEIKETVEEKKHSKEKLKTPCKQCLLSKAENDAVDCFYRLCKDLWNECNVQDVIRVDNNREEMLEDIQEEEKESNQKDIRNEHIELPSVTNQPPNLHPAPPQRDSCRNLVRTLEGERNYGHMTSQMAMQYNDFHQKYLTQRHKNSQLHVVAAYKIFEEQLKAYNTNIQYANERESNKVIEHYLHGENSAMQLNYYSK